MELFSLLGGPFSGEIDKITTTGTEWLKPIARFMDNIIVPVTIVVAILGAIWTIWLGVKLAKAETKDKATEAKQALIRVAIACLSVLVIIWVLAFVASHMDNWMTNNNPFGTGTEGESKGTEGEKTDQGTK